MRTENKRKKEKRQSRKENSQLRSFHFGFRDAGPGECLYFIALRAAEDSGSIFSVSELEKEKAGRFPGQPRLLPCIPQGE
jgi:hypothetical protein